VYPIFDYKSVDGVVFDFGGVITVSPRNGWSLYPYCAAHGLNRAQVDEGWTNYRSLWDGGHISFEEMYRRIFADAGKELTPAMVEELWEIDAVAWIRQLRPDTLELMQALKAGGKKVGILTNMSPDFHERLFVPRAAAYRALADMEVVSGFEKICKPDPAIYALAAERMGLPPGRLLFLDDTPINVLTAKTLGWKAEVYPDCAP